MRNQKVDYDARWKNIVHLYRNQFQGQANEARLAWYKAELTADLVGDYLFSDDQFINNLYMKQPNIFKKIYEEIKYLVKTVAPGSKESKQLEKVKRAFDKVYKESSTSNSDTRFSLMKFEADGRRYVEIDQEQDRFEGHDRSEYPRIAKDIINEKFNGKVVGIDNKMYVNGQGRDEFSNPSKYIEGDVYDAKMRSAGELDNMLDAGTNFRNEPDGRDGHVHPDVIGGFDYFDTLFKIGDNFYEAVINIKNISRGKLFKDVTKIKDVTQDIMSSYGKNPKSQFLRTSSMDSIPQTEEKSSGLKKNSLSDKNDIAPTGTYNIYGSDIELEIPIRDDVAPVQQSAAVNILLEIKEEKRRDLTCNTGCI